jgi:hypothetical protein
MLFLAYIDPGSGTLLIQVLIAGAVAVPFFFRRVFTEGWRRVRGAPAETPKSPTAPEDE